uniref:Uncharacterized protein n=1 Tax=Acartia pacifica TaxID=335913 RepID=A0A0U2V6C3_ACAPC|nr:hypothetical protein [Acartia pacifica]
MGKISKGVPKFMNRQSMCKKRIPSQPSEQWGDEIVLNDEQDEVFYPTEVARCHRKQLDRISAKSGRIRKARENCGGRSNKISEALKSAFSRVPGAKSLITDHLSKAIETVHDSIPMAVNLLVPLALKSMLPGGMGKMASSVVSTRVTPVLQERILPTVVNTLIPEEVRYELAIQKSLQHAIKTPIKKTSSGKNSTKSDRLGFNEDATQSPDSSGLDSPEYRRTYSSESEDSQDQRTQSTSLESPEIQRTYLSAPGSPVQYSTKLTPSRRTRTDSTSTPRQSSKTNSSRWGKKKREVTPHRRLSQQLKAERNV